MKRTCQQDAGGAAIGQCREIPGITHAAGGKDGASRRARDERAQALEVRPLAGADAGEGHGDDLLRPARGILEQRRRTDELVAAKVEREDERAAAGKAGREGGGGQRLAADDGAAQTPRLPGGERGLVGDAGIDPQRKHRKSAPDRLDRGEVVALALNRVEVGEVEGGERVVLEQGADDRERRAARTERGDDWPVARALTLDCAHDRAVQEIDDRDQFQGQDCAPLRLFVYEHITGGGLVHAPLPPSLAHEGELMLRALVDDLTALPGVEVVATRDYRLAALPGPARTLCVGPGEGLEALLGRGLAQAEAIWPVAPESDGILERITRFVAACGVPLLGCSADAVRIAASKLATAQALAAAGIAVAPTAREPAGIAPAHAHLVIKPDDGAGCLATRLHTRAAALAWWRANAHEGYVVQAYIAGEAMSLSLLCADGEAQILACNRQHVHLAGGDFEFAGVSVNAGLRARYAGLASRIARALPGLWGYVGVDLVESEDGPVVIEINPRLTTSYVGLARALGVNPAARVLALRKMPAGRLPPPPAGTTIDIRTRDEH